MKYFLNEECLSQLIDLALDSRVKNLNLEFTAWDEYKELANIKDRMQLLLKEQITQSGTDLLLQYDDAYDMMVAKASDYFYERGFADCLQLFSGTLGRKVE